MDRLVILLRHPEVAAQGRCYGITEVPWSQRGHKQMIELTKRWGEERFDAIFHSGLSRCSLVAQAIAQQHRVPVPVYEDHRLRERHFGVWEGRWWDDIYAETGDAMLGMIRDPQAWRPPGGETTFELRDRVWAWWNDLPSNGRWLVISHGGPIAALLGTLTRLPVEQWPRLIPPPATTIEVHACMKDDSADDSSTSMLTVIVHPR